MNWLFNVLILISAHLSLTAFVPSQTGRWILWPFDPESKPILSMLGGLPSQSGIVIPLLAGGAGVTYIVAFLCRMGWIVPADWLFPSLVVGSVGSILLFSIYLSVWSVLPIVLDLLILWLAMTKRI